MMYREKRKNRKKRLSNALTVRLQDMLVFVTINLVTYQLITLLYVDLFPLTNEAYHSAQRLCLTNSPSLRALSALEC